MCTTTRLVLGRRGESFRNATVLLLPGTNDKHLAPTTQRRSVTPKSNRAAFRAGARCGDL